MSEFIQSGVSNMGSMDTGMTGCASISEASNTRARSVLEQAEANYNELCGLRSRIGKILVRMRGDERTGEACESAVCEAGVGVLSRGVKSTRRELDRLNDMVQELDRLV